MPDEMPSPAAVPIAPPPAPVPPIQPGPTISIGEEFGTAKRNLPPMNILAAAIIAVLVVIGIYSFLVRSKPQGAGSLDNVAAVEIPGQGATMVALTFSLRNTALRTLYVKTLQGKLKSASGESSAEAVSAVDFDRYFQAFPSLKAGSQPALPPETKIQPGELVTRTIIVAFPVTLDTFSKRQSVSVVVQPYDEQVAVVLTK